MDRKKTAETEEIKGNVQPDATDNKTAVKVLIGNLREKTQQLKDSLRAEFMPLVDELDKLTD